MLICAIYILNIIIIICQIIQMIVIISALTLNLNGSWNREVYEILRLSIKAGEGGCPSISGDSPQT